MNSTSTHSTVSDTERFDRASFYDLRYFDEKRTQKEMALEYIQMNGSITPLEALTAFGCFRLAATICELRKDGYDISTELNKGKKNYAIYSLKENDDEQEHI